MSESKDSGAAGRSLERRALFELYPAEVAELAERTRQIVQRAVPGLREEVDHAGKVLGYSVGHCYMDRVCTLHLSRKGLKIGFLHGVDLPDPRGLLKGTGKKHRHVSVVNLKDLRQAGLKPLLKAAGKAAVARRASG